MAHGYNMPPGFTIQDKLPGERPGCDCGVNEVCQECETPYERAIRQAAIRARKLQAALEEQQED